MKGRLALPIDEFLDEIRAKLEHHHSLVIQAAPGSGKTTRVPPALAKAPFLRDKEIVIIEPRRLAAKLAAFRVADELGETAGKTVGYQFRFENVTGPSTKIRFLTEGIFTRRLLSDPTLDSVGAVIVDEFHERHLHGDLALGFLKRLQETRRPDLKIVVMSATLDVNAVATYLGGPTPILSVPGKTFETTVTYRPLAEAPLDQKVALAVREIVSPNLPGDILVFLPGLAEIRRADEAIRGITYKLPEPVDVYPLYADLSKEEQKKALEPGPRRKVILATNVAETSLTIEGVRIVIDSGVARQASYSWWSGLPSLRTTNISKASAIQRAGRAGRTAPGQCVRIYTRDSFESRPPFETPEIQRADLSQTLLELLALGVDDFESFPWFEPPKRQAIRSALTLLFRLGAIGQDDNDDDNDDENANAPSRRPRLTPLGKRMAEISAHPRIARIILEGERLGIARQAATLAAIVAEDLSPKLDVVAATLETSERALGFVGVRARDQFLLRLRGAEPGGPGPARGAPGATIEMALSKALLAGYPDRVAKRRELQASLSRNRGGQTELLLASGGTARLDATALTHDSEYFVTVDIEEKKASGRAGTDLVVRGLAPIEVEWLFDIEPVGITEVRNLFWNPSRERVEESVAIKYDSLIIDEAVKPAASDAEASALLRKMVTAKGLSAFADPEAVMTFLQRLKLYLASGLSSSKAPAGDLGESALAKVCEGKVSFGELRQGSLVDELRLVLPPEEWRKFDELVPELITLKTGRRIKVHYEEGKPPWVESRLQDFFGMEAGPSVLQGRQPLVLHLLAPNRRAVQVTSDLKGFWKNAYPEIRRELSRRYPKHKWPDDPLRGI